MIPEDQSPDDVVRAVFAAANARRWADVVRLGDDEGLREFHQGWSERGTDDDEPDAYLEYNFGVRTAADVAAMTPAEAAERWLHGNDPVVTMRRAAEHFGGRMPPEPELEAMLRRNIEVLGHVAQGVDVAHVLYREWYESAAAATGDTSESAWLPPPRVVVAVRARDGRWRVRMDLDFLIDHMSRNIAIGGPNAEEAKEQSP